MHNDRLEAIIKARQEDLEREIEDSKLGITNITKYRIICDECGSRSECGNESLINMYATPAQYFRRYGWGLINNKTLCYKCIRRLNK